MGNSGAQVGGIQSVAAADSTVTVAGGTAVTIKANVGTVAGSVAAGNDNRFGKIGDVTVTGIPTNGQIPIATGPATAAWGNIPGGTGTGDVVGPNGATSGNMALFDGTTGKLLKDGGPVAVTAAQISDAGVTGKALLAADTGPDARAAIGAGTSDLVIGTGPTDAMAGDTPIPSSADQVGGVLQSAGIVVVNHGTNAATARPAGVAVVYWIGTVAPTNAVAGDLGYGW